MTTRQFFRLLPSICLIWAGISSADDTFLPASFVCEQSCSEPGLNQLNVRDGEFRVYASLTPEYKVFAEGQYELQSDSLVLVGDGYVVTFRVENNVIEVKEKTLDVVRLVWVAGGNDYFKSGIQFVETVPVLYGVPSRCLSEPENLTSDPECMIE